MRNRDTVQLLEKPPTILYKIITQALECTGIASQPYTILIHVNTLEEFVVTYLCVLIY